ncbi:MAG TPA: hypothetical protein VG294_13050 [Solirubrobacteraceae bacterium]|jgi:hypothetical protein|nr:hypothetical protein [Solirubrobacteraceae bacterium]
MKDVRPPLWLWLWSIGFPLIVAGGAYAVGGLGPGLVGLVLAGVSSAVGARFLIRHGMPGTNRTATGTHEAPAVLFRRLWLVLVFAVIVGLLIAIATIGVHAATVAMACCGLLILVGGGVALAVMNKTDGGA